MKRNEYHERMYHLGFAEDVEAESQKEGQVREKESCFNAPEKEEVGDKAVKKTRCLINKREMKMKRG